MAQNLSLNALNGPGIIECPVCKQTIDASSTQCRFCSAPIDPATAEAAEKEMARTNQACSDASFLRTAALATFVFFGLLFVPFLTLLGVAGSYFLAVALPFLSIRWWIRFHGIRSNDREFRRARFTVIVISALAALPALRIILAWL